MLTNVPAARISGITSLLPATCLLVSTLALGRIVINTVTYGASGSGTLPDTICALTGGSNLQAAMPCLP